MGQNDAAAEEYLHRCANNGQQSLPSKPKLSPSTLLNKYRDQHFVAVEEACKKDIIIPVCQVQEKQREFEISHGLQGASTSDVVEMCPKERHTCIPSISALYRHKELLTESLEATIYQKCPGLRQVSLKRAEVVVKAADTGVKVSLVVCLLQLAAGVSPGDKSGHEAVDESQEEGHGLGHAAARLVQNWLYGDPVRFADELFTVQVQISRYAHLRRLIKLQPAIMRTVVSCFYLRPFIPDPATQAYVMKSTERGAAMRRFFLDMVYMLVVQLEMMSVKDSDGKICEALGPDMYAAWKEFKAEFEALKLRYQTSGVIGIWKKGIEAYLDDEYTKPTANSKRGQESSEPARAQKKRRIDDRAADVSDEEMIGVYLRAEAPASGTVKVMMSLNRLRIVNYAEVRLQKDPNLKNMPMDRITHAELKTILHCIESSDNHPRHLQDAIRASVYAKRLNNNDKLFKEISQKVSDLLREGGLSRTQLRECHAAAMEHPDLAKIGILHAATLSSSHQSDGHWYTEELLRQEKDKQSRVRKWLAQYAIRHGPDKPITGLVAHWQKEGEIPRLELDVRIVYKYYWKKR